MRYRFNPMLHPSLRHIVPNIGVTTRDQHKEVESNVYRTDSAIGGNFSTMRLGRIVTSEKASPIGSGADAFKYGFRFLYNPSTVSGGLSVGTGFIPDPSSQITAILQKGLENITFQILLNRSPDVMGRAPKHSYSPSLTEEAWENIQRFGTQYDLEFLYRCCNGTHNTTTRTHTGDIGILLPNPVELYLGPFRSRGAIASISAVDKMFSPEMVPVLTEVTVTFSRFLNMAPFADVNPGADATTSSGSTGDSRGGTALKELMSGEGGIIDFGSIFDRFNGIFGDNFGDFSQKIKEAVAAGDGAVPTTPPDPNAPPADPNAPPADPATSNPATPVGNNLDAPLPGRNIVTSGWNYNGGGFHGAWDYGPSGIYGHPVHSCREGTVVKVRQMTTSYGKHIAIKTGNIYHYYCHMSALVDTIKEGMVIPAGTHLGNVGSTGNSTGPHLHYEERVNDKYEGGRQHPTFAIAGPGSVAAGKL